MIWIMVEYKVVDIFLFSHIWIMGYFMLGKGQRKPAGARNRRKATMKIRRNFDFYP